MERFNQGTTHIILSGLNVNLSYPWGDRDQRIATLLAGQARAKHADVPKASGNWILP